MASSLSTDECRNLMTSFNDSTNSSYTEGSSLKKGYRQKRSCFGLLPPEYLVRFCGLIWLGQVLFNFIAFHYYQSTLTRLGFGSNSIQSVLAMQAAMAVTTFVLLLIALHRESHDLLFTFLIYLTFSMFLYALIAFLLMLNLIQYERHSTWTYHNNDAWKMEEKRKNAVLEIGWFMFSFLSFSIFYACFFFAICKRLWRNFRTSSRIDMRAACGIPSSFMAKPDTPLVKSPPSYRVPLSVFKHDSGSFELKFPQPDSLPS